MPQLKHRGQKKENLLESLLYFCRGARGSGRNLTLESAQVSLELSLRSTLNTRMTGRSRHSWQKTWRNLFLEGTRD